MNASGLVIYYLCGIVQFDVKKLIPAARLGNFRKKNDGNILLTLLSRLDSASAPIRGARNHSGKRWFVCSLLFTSAKLSYFEKTSLSSLINKLISFEEGLESSSKTGGQVLVDSVVL